MSKPNANLEDLYDRFNQERINNSANDQAQITQIKQSMAGPLNKHQHNLLLVMTRINELLRSRPEIKGIILQPPHRYGHLLNYTWNQMFRDSRDPRIDQSFWGSYHVGMQASPDGIVLRESASLAEDGDTYDSHSAMYAKRQEALRDLDINESNRNNPKIWLALSIFQQESIAKVEELLDNNELALALFHGKIFR